MVKIVLYRCGLCFYANLDPQVTIPVKLVLPTKTNQVIFQCSKLTKCHLQDNFLLTPNATDSLEPRPKKRKPSSQQQLSVVQGQISQPSLLQQEMHPQRISRTMNDRLIAHSDMACVNLFAVKLCPDQARMVSYTNNIMMLSMLSCTFPQNSKSILLPK